MPKRRREPAVYILRNYRNGTLYVGVTSNLIARLWIHREGLLPGFTQRYGLHRLAYFELRETMTDAIQREKELKRFSRVKKLNLIESINPQWRDLYPELLDVTSQDSPGSRNPLRGFQDDDKV
ncbi:endonuclease [Ahniella affigens]|uniref:Endonuclease n=1 Tax=Ahniella affigens TaxID=2021234 RepID=A0A2P1PVG7_9GAMM|nr:endonuclease [Ahniella affigens]